VPKNFANRNAVSALDAQLLARNAFDSGSRDAARLSDGVRHQPERVEELLSKHLAGVQRRKSLDELLGHLSGQKA
jgi:hypothetical protein